MFLVSYPESVSISLNHSVEPSVQDLELQCHESGMACFVSWLHLPLSGLEIYAFVCYRAEP